MNAITEAELRELEKQSALYPGIINPDVLTQLIASVRYLRQRAAQAEEEGKATARIILSLKDEMTLRDERDAWKARWMEAERRVEEMEEQHILYRQRLAGIIRDVRNQRRKKKRRR